MNYKMCLGARPCMKSTAEFSPSSQYLFSTKRLITQQWQRRSHFSCMPPRPHLMQFSQGMMEGGWENVFTADGASVNTGTHVSVTAHLQSGTRWFVIATSYNASFIKLLKQCWSTQSVCAWMRVYCVGRYLPGKCLLLAQIGTCNTDPAKDNRRYW